MSQGGIFTGRGEFIPPAPTVTNEVEAWGVLVKDLRHSNYTPDQIRNLVREDQKRRADEIAKGTTEGMDALAGD